MRSGDPNLITPRQAIARLARGERVAFVDARGDDPVARSGCRIPGAVRLGPGAIQRHPGPPGLPRGATLVVYGEHGRSFEAAAVAAQLDAHGFCDVVVLAGGFRGWSELRCPTELASRRPHAPAGRAGATRRPALRVVEAPAPARVLRLLRP